MSTQPKTLDPAGMEQVSTLLASMQDEVTKARVMKILPRILEIVAAEGHAGLLSLAMAGTLLLPKKRPDIHRVTSPSMATKGDESTPAE